MIIPPPPKIFPPVRLPRGVKRYIGIVQEKDDVLPRDQRAEGRDRHFWGFDKRDQGMSVLADKVDGKLF